MTKNSIGETKDGTPAEGDPIQICTDGITEAAGLKPGFFGVDRLIKLIRSSRTERPADSLLAIIKNLNSFFDNQPANDDITMLIVDRASKKTLPEDCGRCNTVGSNLLAGSVP